MSAIAVIYEQTNTPVDAGVLARVLACLHHRGPHGSDHVLLENAALGHCHFRTTPEEQEESQPLRLKDLPFWIVLDGRLDNRKELFERLSLSPAEGKHLSDAGLILEAYARWGSTCFEYFIGEFALVIYDERNRSLVCARDPLGDRTLFYSMRGTRLTIASEPRAVAEAEGRVDSDELNGSAVAHYFARQAPGEGQTFYKDVLELLPARVMLVNTSGIQTRCYWQVESSIRTYGKSKDEYAARFLSLLDESVRCRLRTGLPAGVLMSGGLDSTSVACLAARAIAPDTLTTISYVFDDLVDCDERPYIEAVRTKWNTCSIQIPSDDAWPLRNWDEWPHNPNYPEGSPYRLLRERALFRAGQEGLNVLLTGGFGDHLYGAGREWLADMLVQGRFREAGRELGLYLRYAGFGWLWRAGYVQHALRHWRKSTNMPPKKIRRADYPWLTDYAFQQVEESRTRSDPGTGPYEGIIGVTPALSSSGEAFFTNRHSIEFRHPYRDRRLVEYVLSLPADQLYFHNVNKRILRSALKGVLPEIIRTRLQPTTIETLFFRGVSREKERIDAILRKYGEVLHAYVGQDWMAKHFDLQQPGNMDDTASTVFWSCVSYLRWYSHSFQAVAV